MGEELKVSQKVRMPNSICVSWVKALGVAFGPSKLYPGRDPHSPYLGWLGLSYSAFMGTRAALLVVPALNFECALESSSPWLREA